MSTPRRRRCRRPVRVGPHHPGGRWSVFWQAEEAPLQIGRQMLGWTDRQFGIRLYNGHTLVKVHRRISVTFFRFESIFYRELRLKFWTASVGNCCRDTTVFEIRPRGNCRETQLERPHVVGAAAGRFESLRTTQEVVGLFSGKLRRPHCKLGGKC